MTKRETERKIEAEREREGGETKKFNILVRVLNECSFTIFYPIVVS